jgi:hypothetical protein
MVGGNGNSAVGSRSSVGGGQTNNASASYSVIAGGKNNTIQSGAELSMINGGAYCNISGSGYSSASGYQITITNKAAHVLGSYITSDRDNTTFVSNLSIKSIPTSAAGLPSGSVWSNGNVLNIV